MKKLQMFIGEFFAKTYKQLSEAKDDLAMKEFESEAEAFAGMLGEKDAKIAELTEQLASAKTSEADAARITSLEGELATAQADKKTAETNLAAEKTAHEATKKELSAFGETPEARKAYADQKHRMDTWYADDKRQKGIKGDDLGQRLNNSDKETREEREARIAELKAGFGKTFKG